MSITATGAAPVVITVGTTATTDARTTTLVTADTRAWRYSDAISATTVAAASVTDYGLEFETQGGGALSFTHNLTATINQTLLPTNTTGTAAVSLIGSGNNVTYNGNGTVTSSVASGVVLTQTAAGSGSLTANVNNNISTSANGSVGALIVDQFSSTGTGGVFINLATGITISQTGDADTYGGVFAKARGTAGDARVVIEGNGTTTINANGSGIAGIQADSLSGQAAVLPDNTNDAVAITVTGTGTGGNAGIFAASGDDNAGLNTVVVQIDANSTISVTGGDDNSGIFARNYTDDPNTGLDVVSTGNISITTGAGSTITVTGENAEGIGAYTNADTGTATSITILANGGGSTIGVTGDNVAGINAHQQATTNATGNVSVTTNAGHTINVTDATGASGTSYGIHATSVGTGSVTVTSASTINAPGTADVIGISAEGSAAVTVNMTAGQIGTSGARAGIGIDVATNGITGDVSVTAQTIFSVADAVRARADGVATGNLIVNVNGALNSSTGVGVHLIGGTTNTIDATAAISGNVGIQVAGGTTTLTSSSGSTTITGTAALDIDSGTLVVGNGSITLSGGITDDGVFAVNRTTAFSVAGVISGSGAVEQNGSGTTTFSGNNSYTGVTSINAGALNIQSANALGGSSAGTTVASGAALEIQGNIAVTAAEALSIAGTGVGGTGALRNVSGSNSYSGTVTLTGAARIQSDAGSLTLNAANAVTATDQNLTIGGAGNGVIGGTITTGAGTLTKEGAGTWTLNGVNTYTGATAVNIGTLVVNGSIANSTTTVANGATLKGSGNLGDLTVQNGATFAPGNSAGISTTGDFTLDAGSTLEIEIEGAGGPGPGGYDQVVVNGTVTLAGNLSTLLLGGFHPATGAAHTIIDNDDTDLVNGTFANVGATFTQGGSTYSITYTGGTGNDVVLTALNDAATVANLNGDTASFIEDGSAVLLDQGGDATVLDPDSANFDTGTVTASITAGEVAGEDVLGIQNQGTGAGQIGVSGSDVTFENVLIGTFTGGSGGTDLVVTLNASATPAAVQALVRALTYSNSNLADPATAPRTVAVTVTDGDGGTSNVSSVTVNVTPVNDQPTLTATSDNPTFIENGAAVDLFDTVLASTVEAGQNIDQLVLTVTNVAGDGSTENLTIDGTIVFLTDGNSQPTATPGTTASVALLGGTATVTIFNAAGLSSAAVQTLVDTLAYDNTSEDPGAASRVVTLTSVRDTGANGGVNNDDNIAALNIPSTVTVTPVNDAPTLTANPANLDFTEGAGLGVQGAAVAVFTGTNIDTVEPGQEVSSLTFTVGGLRDGANERLVVDGTIITLGANSSNTTSGNGLSYTVTLTGSPANQTATIALTSATGISEATANGIVNGITYQNTSVDDPTAGGRTFTLTQIQDEGGTANGGIDSTVLSVASTVDVIALNDGPVTSAPGGTIAAQEDTAVAITGISVTDADAAPEQVQITLSVNNGILDVRTDVAGGLDAAHVSGDTTDTVILTGTTAQINATLASASGLTYQGDFNFDGADQLTVTTSDLGHSGNGGALTDLDTRAITVANVTADTLSAFQSSVLTVDIDGDGQVDPGDTVTVTVEIANNSATTAATGVSFNETLSGLTQVGGVHVTPIAFDDAFAGVQGNSPINLNVLGNDVDPNGLNSGLTIAGVDTTGTAGTVSVNGDGTLLFTPNAGFSGITTFTYFTTDSEGLTSNEASTVTVNVNGGMVWYVDADAAAGGNGSFANPFQSLTELNGLTGDGTTNDDVDGANDTIFIYDNAAGSLSYIGGIVLEANQRLIGDGVAFTANSGIAGATGVVIGHSADNAAGNPTISTSVAAANVVTLASGNTVRGIDLGSAGTGGSSLAGTNFGTLTVDHVAINSATQAINLTNGAFGAGASFTGVTVSTAGITDVSLTNVTGSVDLGGGSMAGQFAVSGGSVSTTYSGSISQSGAGALLNVSGGHSGTLTFNTGTLSATNGTGLQFDNADGTYNLNGTTTLNGGNAGVDILNGSGGTFTFGTGTSITSPTGAAFDLQNSTANVTYSGNVTQANNAALVNVVNEASGTLTFQTGTLSATNGTGLQFANADGTVNFNGTTTLNGGDAGIDILAGGDAAAGSTGTFSFGTNTSITNPSGDAFVLAGSDANVTYSGNISDNSGRAVNIDDHDAGTVTFQTGTVTSTGTGVIVANSNGGTVNFNSISTSLTTGANKAVTLDTSNTGGTVNFNHGATGNGLDISTTTGTGFSALGGGTITVQGTGNTINSSGGMALDIESTALGANGLTFDSTTSGGGANGIKLVSVTGGGATGVSLGSGSISGTTGTAFLVGDGAGGANTGGTAAISYSGSITTTGTARAIDIEDRAAGAGNVTLSGTITHSSGNANVILLDDNAAGTITFSGANSVLNGGTSTAVSLTDNTGATISFTGGGLDIDTTSATAFNATGGGTVSVTGSNNSIASTTGTALNVANTTIGSSGLTFHDISANGATNGIILNTTGSSGGLTVTGTGTTGGSGGTIQNTVQGALFTSTSNLSLSNMNFTNPNSGNGTVNNIDTSAFNSAAQAGINMSSVAGATFTNLNMNGGGGSGGAQVGINGQNVSNLTIANSTITGFGDNVGEGDVKLWNLSGTSAVTNSTFGFVPGDGTGGENLFEVRNNTGTLTLNVTGSTFQNTRDSINGSGGISMTAVSNATINLNVSNSDFLNLKTSGIETFARDASTMNVNITDGGVTGNGNNFDPGSTGGVLNTGRAIGLNAEDTAHLNFNINRNEKIYGQGGPIINIFSINTAVVNGRIDNNNASNNASSGIMGGGIGKPGSGINIHPEDSSTANIEVVNNRIFNIGQDPGIFAFNHGDGGALLSPVLNIKIEGNTVALVNNGGTGGGFLGATTGIDVRAGSNAGDTATTTAYVHNNTVTTSGTPFNGSDNVAFLAREGSTGSHLNFQNLGAGANNNARAIATWNGNGNTPVGSAVALDAGGAAAYGSGTPTAPSNPNALLAQSDGGVQAAEWQFAGSGDFNGDGAADLLSLRSDGLLRVDTFNSAGEATNWYILGQLQPGWQIVGTGDINADGTADILLRHDDGLYQAELIQNMTVAATVDLELVDGELRIPSEAGTETPPADPAAPADPAVAPDPTGPAGPQPAVTPPAEPASGTIETHLTQAALDGVVKAAVARWEATGLTAAQDAYLQNVTFSVADMSSLYLGSAVPGHITIDSDAAGYGWFLDATPFDDIEFAHVFGGTRLQTDPTQLPAGHIDLLSTVMHELGHQLGIEDSYALTDRDSLMYGYLVTGERRLPGEHDADGATPGSIDHEEFAVGPVNIGTLPANRTVTITFDATVDLQTNKLITNPANQGAVTSSFPAVNTNSNVTTLDSLVLGDRVFLDNITPNNSFDAGEGIDGVALTLFADTNGNGGFDGGDTLLATTTTAGGGLYSFVELAPGNYIVRVDQANFNAGGVLHDGTSAALSLAGQPDPDNNVDNDDNGAAFAGNGVVSLAISLDYDTEPTSDGGTPPKNDVNTTLDFGFAFVPPNAAPTVTAGSTVGFSEATGAAVQLEAGLTVADADSDPIQSATVQIVNFFAGDVLSFTIPGGSPIVGSYNPGNGTLTFSGSDTAANYETVLRSVTFDTASDNPDGQPTPGAHTPRNITWTVNDGTQNNTVAASTTVNITPENDAPVLLAGQTPVLNTINEDAGAPGVGAGTLISALVDFAGGGGNDNVTEPDGTALTGIALTSVNAANGTWLFSIDGGNVWTPINAGTLSDSSALLLAADAGTRLYFQPNGDFNGTVGSAITFRAWDQSQGSNGQTGVDTSANGLATAFSIATDTADITVTAVADIANDLATTNEDTAIDVLVFANDTFDGTPAITGTTNGLHGTVTVDDNGSPGDTTDDFVVYTPDADYNGSDSFDYTVTSGGVTETATVNVTINAVADIADDTVTVAEDSGSNTLNLFANDSFEDAGRAITAVGAAGNGVTAINDNNTPGIPTDDFVTYTPNANYFGSDSFTYTVTSGGLTEQATVNVTVTEVNDAPTATDDVVTPAVDEDTGTRIIPFADLLNNDSTGPANENLQTLTITAVSNPVGGTVQINGTNVEFTPDPDFNGTASFDYTIEDNGTTNGAPAALTDVGHASFTVDSVNDAPVLTLAASVLFTENGPPVALDGTATVADVELDAFDNYNGATLTLARQGGADADDVFGATGTLSLSGGNVLIGATTIGTFTNAAGTLAIAFNANATAAEVDSVLQQITYSNPNDTPPATVDIDYVFDDGNVAAQGSGGALQDTGTIQVDISATNDAPVSTVPAGPLSALEETDFEITGLSVADTDADPALITVTLSVLNGTLTVRDDVVGGLDQFEITGNGTGTVSLTCTQSTINTTLAAINGVVYRGATNFFGADTLTMTSNDGGANGNDPGLTGDAFSEEDTATVQINVANVNDPPIAGSSSAATNQNTGHAFAAAEFAFSDPIDNGAHSLAAVVIASLASHGNLTFNGNPVAVNDVIPAGQLGSLVYTPTANYFGADTFTFRIRDDGGTANGGIDTSTNIGQMSIFVFDITPPAAPVIQTFSTNTGSPADNITTDNTLHLTGTAEAFSTVRVFDGGTEFGNTTTANGLGNWAFDTGFLPSGQHSFQANATDVSNNTGVLSETFAVNIVPQPAAGPAVPFAFSGIAADFDGDGLNDVLQVSGGSALVWLSTGASFTANQLWTTGATANDRAADVNGDGAADLVQYFNGTEYVALSNGASAFGAWTPWASGATASDQLGDFNGDGRADLLQLYNGNSYVALSNGTSFGAFQHWSSGTTATDRVVNVNADARADLFQIYDGHVWTELSNGTSFNEWHNGLTGATANDRPADVNGDGAIDVVQYYNNSLYVALSNGPVQGFTPFAVWQTAATANDQLGDFNGDGRADALQLYNGTAYVALSNGADFLDWTPWTTGATATDRPVDLNGDNRLDLLQVSDGHSFVALSNGTSFDAWHLWV